MSHVISGGHLQLGLRFKGAGTPGAGDAPQKGKGKGKGKGDDGPVGTL
jgi:hypothetical protein